jgi:hypothetical protein
MLNRLAIAGVGLMLLAGLCFAQTQGPGRSKGSTSRGGSVAPADPNAPKGVFPTAHGIVKSVSGSQLFVEVDEDHEMKFRLIRKTKVYIQSKEGLKEIKASSLKPGQTVDIDMQSSLDGAFEAVHITVLP